ncbi:MAG: cytochrome c556 [Halocynthiibacter sp.]|jgi:cytochrome c556
MRRLFTVSVLTLAIFASGANAHEDVKNETVKARMMAMSAIGGAMKTVGGMAQGKVAFDAEAAAAAVAVMEAQSAKVPALFEAQEGDPKSEAKPEIWTNWDDFVAKSNALNAAAKAADTSSVEALGASLGALGGACKACHTAYRL